MPKSKGRVKTAPKPVDVVEVRGMPIPCNETKINNLLGCTFWTHHDLAYKVEKNTLDDFKAWRSPLISIAPRSWLVEG